MTHIRRESPRHSRPESLPERSDPIRSNQLPRAIEETTVRPVGSGLQPRLDRLLSVSVRSIFDWSRIRDTKT